MGSWLFSSNACNISSCEFRTHPGAHRLVYVRRPRDLIAFQIAMKTGRDSTTHRHPNGAEPVSKRVKTAAYSCTRETTHSPNCQSAVFSRVGRFFPESAAFGTSGPFFERVGRFWNESTADCPLNLRSLWPIRTCRVAAGPVPGASFGVTMDTLSLHLPRPRCSASCLAGAADLARAQHDDRFGTDLRSPRWKRWKIARYCRRCRNSTSPIRQAAARLAGRWRSTPSAISL